MRYAGLQSGATALGCKLEKPLDESAHNTYIVWLEFGQVLGCKP